MSNSYVNHLVEYSTPIHLKDELYEPILKAILAIGGYWSKWRPLYEQIKTQLGTTEEQRARRVVPHPNGTEISETNFRGLVRSWVEERSPYSRQYYFRNGLRTTWSEYERPKLFVNIGLGKANIRNHWMPYTYARGDAWILYPKMAALFEGPTQKQLTLAAAKYKRTGTRARRTRPIRTKIIGKGTIRYPKPLLRSL